MCIHCQKSILLTSVGRPDSYLANYLTEKLKKITVNIGQSSIYLLSCNLQLPFQFVCVSVHLQAQISINHTSPSLKILCHFSQTLLNASTNGNLFIKSLLDSKRGLGSDVSISAVSSYWPLKLWCQQKRLSFIWSQADWQNLLRAQCYYPLFYISASDLSVLLCTSIHKAVTVFECFPAPFNKYTWHTKLLKYSQLHTNWGSDLKFEH